MYMGKNLIGRFSSVLNKKIILILVLQALVIISLSGYHAWNTSSVECVKCHSNMTKMKKLGHPEFYLTQKMVEEQSKHAFIECRDCHLGNGRATDKDKAHKGMLKMLIVGEDGRLKKRQDYYPDALGPTGDNKIYELLPKIEVKGQWWITPEVRNILWHDRNPETLNFDPAIAKKTCAKSNCHAEQLKQFSTTIMGRNFRQRTMKTWTKPYGPHNCGPSFADLPPAEVLESAGFDYRNTRAIQENLNVHFTKQEAKNKQKFCNVCHAGCLDCHFTPVKGKPHKFTRVPRSESCAGFGRGTSICHSGAMQSRRGETYIGGDYSVPAGMKPDVHYTKNIQCVDCHPMGEMGMGDMERKASCRDCHIAIEEAHSKSIHKDLDCATCHINELRGYQITIWGPGNVAGKENPFNKFAYYYGIQTPPILIKDQKGKWMPVKIWPHSVSNIKNDVPASTSIEFRWPKGETRDAYYIVGTFDNLPGDNKHLLWLEIEQAAHPVGKARSCKSCHGPRQVSVSKWKFYDNQGAEPFDGTYTIIADNNGIRIRNIHNTTPIKLLKGYSLSDFASWLYLKDKWQMPGDFSIKTDIKKYRHYLVLDKKTENKLKALDKISREFNRKTLRRYLNAKGAAIHYLDGAEETLAQFLSNRRLRK